MGPLVNGHLQAAPGFAGWQEEWILVKRAAETFQPRGETKKIIFRSARPRSRARISAAAAGARCRECEPRGDLRRTHPLAGLGDRLVGEPDNGNCGVINPPGTTGRYLWSMMARNLLSPGWGPVPGPRFRTASGQRRCARSEGGHFATALHDMAPRVATPEYQRRGQSDLFSPQLIACDPPSDIRSAFASWS
jgi:hypothetical protein